MKQPVLASILTRKAFKPFGSAVLIWVFAIAGAGPIQAASAEQLAVRWTELQPVIAGRQISVRLSDGTAIDGLQARVTGGSLSINVTKTSDAAKHPAGASVVAKSEVARITVKRRTGWKARTIGLIAGGAIAATAAGVLSAQSKNEVGSITPSTAGLAAAGGGGAIAAGYLIGWGIDRAGSRPEQVVTIIPE